MFHDELDIDSNCSTPYVSAPSSPGRNAAPSITGFYHSAPSSPVHFILSTFTASVSHNPSVSLHFEASPASSNCSFEFDFSTGLTINNGASSPEPIIMTSADELFFNGQIRPMKIFDVINDVTFDADELGVTSDRGRAAKYLDKSGRRTRSLSPLRSTPFGWQDDFEALKNEGKEKMDNEVNNADGIEGNESGRLDLRTTSIDCESRSSSRSSSAGRNSKKWVFLKELLYRSKSEGRNNGHKFWGSLSFSPVKDKIKTEKCLAPKNPSNVFSKKKSGSTRSDSAAAAAAAAASSSEGVNSSSVLEAKREAKNSGAAKPMKKQKTVNGIGKRRVPPSAHELHYTANRAQAEEMRKKTFLPYKQGLLGCLGFSSKSYGAMNGFARSLNSVSSG